MSIINNRRNIVRNNVLNLPETLSSSDNKRSVSKLSIPSSTAVPYIANAFKLKIPVSLPKLHSLNFNNNPTIDFQEFVLYNQYMILKHSCLLATVFCNITAPFIINISLQKHL
jgi:hypothetical protein